MKKTRERYIERDKRKREGGRAEVSEHERKGKERKTIIMQ